MPILDFLQVGAWHHRGRLADGWMWLHTCGSQKEEKQKFPPKLRPLDLGNLGMTWGQGLEGMAGPTEAQAGPVVWVR